MISTADSPNRLRDKERIEKRNLCEFGNDKTLFYTEKGTLVAVGYTRVVYGDHGPYIEFLPRHIVRDEWIRGKQKSVKAWYDECWPIDGSDCKLYYQKRDVKMLKNPPPGKYSCNNNRSEGYADYKVGFIYISPDDLTWGNDVYSLFGKGELI